MDRVPEPRDGDERGILLGWLAFDRNALAAKSAGLDAAQLVERSASPSVLSLRGLVRHLTEMERVYAVWALGPKAELEWVGVSAGNGYSVRWNLQKLIREYARHNGHADLIRERIDGQTGE